MERNGGGRRLSKLDHFSILLSVWVTILCVAPRVSHKNPASVLTHFRIFVTYLLMILGQCVIYVHIHATLFDINRGIILTPILWQLERTWHPGNLSSHMFFVASFCSRWFPTPCQSWNDHLVCWYLLIIIYRISTRYQLNICHIATFWLLAPGACPPGKTAGALLRLFGRQDPRGDFLRFVTGSSGRENCPIDDLVT